MTFLNQKFKTVAFWIFFWMTQSFLMSGGEHLEFYFIKNIAIVGLQLMIVYLNSHFWFPLLFSKGRYFLFFLINVIIIYLTFSCSFFLIGVVLTLFTDRLSSGESLWLFSLDFWTVLSGSSLYSLSFLASTIFLLLKNKDATNEGIQDLNTKNSIVIKDGSKSHIISFDDILYIKGLKEYVVWQSYDKSIVALDTLKNLEEEYKTRGFMRIHKSYIVNTYKIDSFKSNSVIIGDYELPIGRTYKKDSHHRLRDLISNKK